MPKSLQNDLKEDKEFQNFMKKYEEPDDDIDDIFGDVDALLNSISVNFDLNYTKTTDNRVLISKAPISTIQTEKYFNTQ